MDKLTVLEVSNLSKSYGKVIGVKDISFKLKQGSILGLIGPNGSGKTTTIKSILNLLKKDSGDVLYFNKKMEENLDMIFKFVGYVSSLDSLYENLTGKDFLAYANSFYEANYEGNIVALAKRLNLNLEMKVKNMSLGNKRKLSIINALFHEPRIIIFDEPTNGLDPLARMEFEKILKEERKKGNSILYSSHNLAEISNVCDEVLIIKDGALIKDVSLKTIQVAHKKVFLQTKDLITSSYFNHSCVSNLVIEDKKVSFLYNGDLKYLTKKLDNIELIDLNIQNLTLEEIFINYYDNSN